MTVQTESRRTRFLNLAREFRVAWFFFGVVAVLSAVATVVSALFPITMQLLWSSVETPWGVVTGIFVHSLDAHLYSNIITIALYFFLFMSLSMFFSFEPKPAKAKSLVIIVFATAVFANIVSLMLMPQFKSIGASGIAFAISGALFAEAFKNVLLSIHSRLDLHTPAPTSFFISNLLVFLNLGFILLLSPTVFFNVASGVNFFVHIFSFFSGYLCYLMYALYKNKDVVMGRKPITPQG